MAMQGMTYLPGINPRLGEFEESLSSLTGEIGDYCRRYLETVKLFLQAGESTHSPVAEYRSTSSVGVEVPLDTSQVDKFRHLLPTEAELEHSKRLFDQLEGLAREAAFTLAWYVRELQLGRVPMTKERLESV